MSRPEIDGRVITWPLAGMKIDLPESMSLLDWHADFEWPDMKIRLRDFAYDRVNDAATQLKRRLGEAGRHIAPERGPVKVEPAGFWPLAFMMYTAGPYPCFFLVLALSEGFLEFSAFFDDKDDARFEKKKESFITRAEKIASIYKWAGVGKDDESGSGWVLSYGSIDPRASSARLNIGFAFSQDQAEGLFDDYALTIDVSSVNFNGNLAGRKLITASGPDSIYDLPPGFWETDHADMEIVSEFSVAGHNGIGYMSIFFDEQDAFCAADWRSGIQESIFINLHMWSLLDAGNPKDGRLRFSNAWRSLLNSVRIKN